MAPNRVDSKVRYFAAAGLNDEWLRSRYEVSALVQPRLRDWAHFLRGWGWAHRRYLGKNWGTSRSRHSTKKHSCK